MHTENEWARVLELLHLGGTLTRHGLHRSQAPEVTLKPGEKVAPLPRPGQRTIGRGVQAGVVYRLADGRLVYVQQAPGGGTATSTTGTATTP